MREHEETQLAHSVRRPSSKRALELKVSEEAWDAALLRQRCLQLSQVVSISHAAGASTSPQPRSRPKSAYSRALAGAKWRRSADRTVGCMARPW